MATKKNFRSDNTYMYENSTGDKAKLGAKVLSDGRESLFLDLYDGYDPTYNEATGKKGVKIRRKREYLHLYLYPNAKTPIEREQNRQTLELAKRIKFERGQQMLERQRGYSLPRNRDVNFLDYFQTYYNDYTKKDKGMIKMAYHRFVDFLNDTPKYNHLATNIKSSQIDKDMIMAFTEYLQSRSKGEGAKSVYSRFKKVISYAVEHGVMATDPCKHISIKVDTNILRKDVLSQDEMKALMATPFNGNPEVRRAFLLSLYTGVRYCDVKELTFANVDFSRKLLSFEQNKTRGHSGASGVVSPLNEGLLGLIGRPRPDDPAGLLFALPSYRSCIKHIQRWVDDAGIKKHITWHCARHTFATIILSNGANINTVASLLGHSSIQMTQKYTRVVDELKQEAINSLPELPDLDN